MVVGDIMTENTITVGQEEPVLAAARLLLRHNLGALPVCDSGGRLRGVVTDRDIVLRCVAAEEDPARQRVSEIMSRAVVTAERTESLEQISGRMAGAQLRRLPVTDNGRVIGMVTLCDLARRADCSMEAGEALRSISSNIRRR